MIDAFAAELAAGFPDAPETARVTLRLLVSLIVGALIGFQREQHGKNAGLRTHMLVAFGTCLFVVAGVESGMAADSDAMSRIVQGIVTGIGFLGAGAILKLYDDREILGLTTAAGIWMTAAASVAAGLGRFGMALAGAIVAYFVLAVLSRLERRVLKRIGDKS
jgi:putative Mg2+ transporter-C (MgtC) family protein